MLSTFRKGNTGAVAVEAAIVIPILLVLALSVADFGRYYFTALTMKQATAEAARAVALKESPSYVAALIENSLGAVPQFAAGDSLAKARVQSNLTCPPTPSTTANLIKVGIDLDFVWLTPLGFLYGADTSGWSGAMTNITISSEAVCAA